MPSVERVRPYLGTLVTIRVVGTECPDEVQFAAIASAFAAIGRVDRLMSFHRPNSDISRLNKSRPGRYVRVHRWTHAVLREALMVSSASQGAFDCNVGATLMRAGLLPRASTISLRSRRPMYQALTLARTNLIRINARLSLDVGGIAKGFAVDQAVRVLRSCGVHTGLVNAGGDLRVFGADAQEIWLRCPDQPTSLRLIGHLYNGAVATSGSYFIDSNACGDRSASAIVSSARGRRVALPGSITVIAKTCMLADALTKIAVLRRHIPALLKMRARAKVVKS